MAEQDRNKKGEEEQEGKRGDTRWMVYSEMRLFKLPVWLFFVHQLIFILNPGQRQVDLHTGPQGKSLGDCGLSSDSQR